MVVHEGDQCERKRERASSREEVKVAHRLYEGDGLRRGICERPPKLGPPRLREGLRVQENSLPQTAIVYIQPHPCTIAHPSRSQGSHRSIMQTKRAICMQGMILSLPQGDGSSRTKGNFKGDSVGQEQLIRKNGKLLQKP
ncbi:hypothetical protein J6590_018404 [Homalodisca vitripennis]|nr:hypothetical protein J6590_018404 [Homalodisca vitripennis]